MPAGAAMLTNYAANDVGSFIGEVLTNCPLLRAIWRVGQPANAKTELASLFVWDLIAFGDPLALHRLRQAPHLHRQNVRLRVVTDGDRFQSAWGIEQSGSLARWEWAQTNAGEAYYNDFAVPAERSSRLRYRAVRLWHLVRSEPCPVGA